MEDSKDKQSKMSCDLKKKFKIMSSQKGYSDLVMIMDKIYSSERESIYKEIENRFLRTPQENNLPKHLTLMRTPEPRYYTTPKSAQSKRNKSDEPRCSSRNSTARAMSRGQNWGRYANEDYKLSLISTPGTHSESKDYTVKSGSLLDKIDSNNLPYYYLNKLRRWNEKDKALDNSRSLSPTDRRKLNKSTLVKRKAQCNALNGLTEICESFQPSKEVIGQVKQEKKILSWYNKRMSWTQETLRKMEQYDHTIIQPLYDHYRSVLDEFEKEANTLSKSYKQSGSDGSKLIGKTKRSTRKKKQQQLL